MRDFPSSITETETYAAAMRRKNRTRYTVPMPGATERPMQIAWRDVDRAPNTGGPGANRRCCSEAVGGVSAAVWISALEGIGDIESLRGAGIDSLSGSLCSGPANRGGPYFQLSGE
jgi:hypothetical protein